MSAISYQAGIDRIVRMAEQFGNTGSVEGAERRPYAQGAEAETVLTGQIDHFIKIDNTGQDHDPKPGVVSTSGTDDSGGLPLIVFTDAQFEGNSKEGALFRQVGLAPNVPSGIALTEFKPESIRQVQVEFDPQEGYQIANAKAVHIDRAHPEQSYEQTLSWNMAYPPGLFDEMK